MAADLDARERTTLRAVAAVVATSDWAARRLVAHHGLAPDRVHVAAPGADPAPLASGTDGVSRLLCVAAVTPRKGQHRLVEALATVADLPWSCVCVGGLAQDPGYVAQLRSLIARHGLGDRLHLAGPQAGAELDASYAAADLLVLASYAETYGMVVTEALARGIPVLATDVGGLPEAVGRAPDGGVPGILVPPEDPGGARRRTARLARRGRRAPPAQGRRPRAARRARRLGDHRTQPGRRPRPAARGAPEGRVNAPATSLGGPESGPPAPPDPSGPAATRSAADEVPRYAPEWLELRERADAAARATELLDPLRARLRGPGGARRRPGDPRPRLRHRLHGPLARPPADGAQHWILHDRDPYLLHFATARHPGRPPTAARSASPRSAATSDG